MQRTSDLSGLHNAHCPVVDSAVTKQKRPIATGLKQEGARSSDALPARIAAKITIEPNTGCWLWLGYVDGAGYGQVRHEGRTTCAHLAVYRELRGEHSTEDLDHRCRVRSCVNPEHLEPVSHRENMRRGSGFAGENARKTHCKRGHEFTAENTREHGKGNRACKLCEKLRSLGLHRPASTPMPAMRRPKPLGLGPATVPPPWELRGSTETLTGARRAVAKRSGYVSPLAWRAEQKGELTDLRARLLAVKAAVVDGATLLDGVADGTLWGWRARLALSDVLTQPLADWDSSPGRTQLERLAVVERALTECGVEHRGGWRVSR